MRIASEDIPIAGFRARCGHFELIIVRFGLTNALAAFMSIVNKRFHDYSDKFMKAYLDDILIYSLT